MMWLTALNRHQTLNRQLAVYWDDPQRRLMLLNAATRVSPKDSGLQVLLGSLLAASNHSEAVDVFRAALSLDPHNMEATNQLGVVLTKHKDFKGASTLYRRATQQQPHNGGLTICA